MYSDRGKVRMAGLMIVVAIGAFLYLGGRLDPLLYRFGLNHHPCTHTLSGSVMCGANVSATPFSDNPGGGAAPSAGGGPSGVPGAAGSVGKSVNGSASGSAKSVP